VTQASCGFGVHLGELNCWVALFLFGVNAQFRTEVFIFEVAHHFAHAGVAGVSLRVVERQCSLQFIYLAFVFPKCFSTSVKELEFASFYGTTL
jgi:hypothetical protein